MPLIHRSVQKENPELFEIYQNGFCLQSQRWPINPITEIIKIIKKCPKNISISDMGCGDAQLAKSVKQKVYSFDLVSNNKDVLECDFTKVPLNDSEIDIVVFCLSLMGTNLMDFFKEASRILKIGGRMLIVEVASRIESISEFISGIESLGFNCAKTVFYVFSII
ncbi:hypothetical protein HZS_3750 [Henneguya salminicola]|nr:hypothetical protein HZS_3750 [Henneguya salminicola]